MQRQSNHRTGSGALSLLSVVSFSHLVAGATCVIYAYEFFLLKHIVLSVLLIVGC